MVVGCLEMLPSTRLSTKDVINGDRSKIPCFTSAPSSSHQLHHHHLLCKPPRQHPTERAQGKAVPPTLPECLSRSLLMHRWQSNPLICKVPRTTIATMGKAVVVSYSLGWARRCCRISEGASKVERQISPLQNESGRYN